MLEFVFAIVLIATFGSISFLMVTLGLSILRDN